MNQQPEKLFRNCHIVATRCRAWWLKGACGVLVLVAGAGSRAENAVPPAGKGTPAAELKKLSLEELMAVEVATVTTASKKAEKVADAPATVMVITATDIRLRGYALLTDVLRDLPGMETIPYTFSEFGTQVPVRGIVGNNKIVVLVNGMRVNPPGGENFPFRSDFSVRDAEQIEVIYGPGSTLYGQDAISCVINVKTKRPAEGLHGEAGADGGLHYERDAWGTFGGVLDEQHNIRLSGYVQYHDSELTAFNKDWSAWWAAYQALAQPRRSGTTPYRDDFGLNGFVRLELFENTSLQLWHRQSERSSSEGGYPQAYVKQAEWADMSTVVEARNILNLSDKVKLDSAVTYNRYEINPATRYVFPTPSLTNNWFLNDYKYGIGQGLTWEETVRAELNDKLSLLGGFMLGTFDVIPKSTVPGGADPDGDVVAQGGTFDYIDPAFPGVTNHIPRVVRVNYQTYAGYIEGGWRMLEQLKVIAGVRVTKDSRFSDVPITPRAALIYDIDEHLTAKYIYTQAYVAPSPYAGNATYDNGSLLATSNGSLKPETAETHEINLTYTKKNFTAGASAYYGRQTEILLVSDQYPYTFIKDVTLTDGTTRHLVHTINSGESQRIGGELYCRATFGPVSPWCSYSYVDFQSKLGNQISGLPGISRHNGRLGVTWAVTPKLFITPSLVIRSTPEDVPPGVLKQQLDLPYDINLYVLYAATKHLELFFQLRNLTDNRYALAGFAQGGQAIPQETLSGVIGARLVY